jgi:hypothetical protein
VRRSAEWLRQAAALGAAIAPDTRVKAFVAVLEATAWVVEYLPEIRSYLDAPRSLQELQDAVTDQRLGYQVHHRRAAIRFEACGQQRPAFWGPARKPGKSRPDSEMEARGDQRVVFKREPEVQWSDTSRLFTREELG